MNNGSDSVTVIDGATNNTTPIPVGFAPNAIAVNENTNKIYVTNYSDSTVTVIDANDSNKTNTISVGFFPSSIAINMITNKVYVTNREMER